MAISFNKESDAQSTDPPAETRASLQVAADDPLAIPTFTWALVEAGTV